MENWKPPNGLVLNEHALNNFRSFEQKFQIFLTASGNGSAEENKKVAMFLNCIGDEALDIYNSFNLDTSKVTLKEVLKAFEDYIKPRMNVVVERHKFFTTTQKEGESFDNFFNCLRKLAKNCEFGEQENSLIRDRIIIAIKDTTVQQRLLRENNINLDRAVDMCRLAELSKLQQNILKMEPELPAVMAVRAGNEATTSAGTEDRREQNSRELSNNYGSEKFQCKKCNRFHGWGKCFAYGKVCNKCKGKNHFAVCCKARFVKKSDTGNMKADGIAEEFYVSAIFKEESKEKQWMETVSINKHSIACKLDTGAECNVLPLGIFQELGLSRTNVVKCDINVVSYSNDKTKALGYIISDCIIKGKECKVKFVIVDIKAMPILGLNACVKLNLISRSPEAKEVKLSFNAVSNTGVIDAVTCNSPKQVFLKENKLYFEGIGTYPGEYRIELKENVTPVVNPNRRVPETVKVKLKETLNRLESRGIVSKVDKVTDWVHNIVVVGKADGSLRICLDPYYFNKCVKSESFPIPTVDELSYKLTGKQLYTVFDMKDGFHQITLDEDSKNLCCFITPFGKYRFERLPMGISSAPEVFQRYNTKIFGDIEGVGIYFDDMIIAAANEEEHDKILKVVLERAKQYKVKFNPNKLQYKVTQVKYLGRIFDADGVRPDPEQVKCILSLEDPTNKKELLRVLGMVNYLAKFIPNVSELTKPLRDLTKKNVDWQWGPEQIAAFHLVKRKISEAPVLKLFDNTLPIVVQADASQFALGACLLQNNQPVAFVSRSLTEVEEKYPQIEKEFLAICFALDKFHQFIYGLKITVQTDHKPIVNIVSKDVHKVTPRLQRLKLKLLRYNLNVTYVPGTKMWVADLLSRACKNVNDSLMYDDSVNEVVHSLKTEVSMSEVRIKQFQEETKKDEVLQMLSKYVLEGWPTGKSNIVDVKVKEFWNIRNEITYSNEMLFWGDRIIPPSCLRSEMIKLAHEPHLGYEKTKKRLQQIFYWPGLSKTVENILERCQVCEIYRRANIKQTLIPHELPTLPFEKVGVDLCEFGNSNYLVLIDYLTKWMEVVPIVNKSAFECIKTLKIIFSIHGIPKVVQADNIPFAGQEFKVFAKDWNFDINTSSPRYPQANGMAEKAVGIAKSILRKTLHGNQDLFSALLEYRNLPISGLDVSPAQLLMSRKLRTKIPIVKSQLQPQIREGRDQLKAIQHRVRNHYDKTACRERVFQENDNVLIRTDKIWQRGKIVGRHNNPRSYYVKNEKGNVIRRNSSHLRYSKNESVIRSSVEDLNGNESNLEVGSGNECNGKEHTELTIGSGKEGNGNDSIVTTNENSFNRQNEIEPAQINGEGNFKGRSRSGRCIREPKWFKDFKM